MIPRTQQLGLRLLLVDASNFIIINLCFRHFFHLCIPIQHVLLAGAIGVCIRSIYIVACR